MPRLPSAGPLACQTASLVSVWAQMTYNTNSVIMTSLHQLRQTNLPVVDVSASLQVPATDGSQHVVECLLACRGPDGPGVGAVSHHVS